MHFITLQGWVSHLLLQLKRIFASDSLTKNTDGGGRRFLMWPGSDLYCAALTMAKILQIRIMGVQTHLRLTRDRASSNAWAKGSAEVFLQSHLSICGQLLQHCWGWQRRSCSMVAEVVGSYFSAPLREKSGPVFFPLTAASKLFKQHCLIRL